LPALDFTPVGSESLLPATTENTAIGSRQLFDAGYLLLFFFGD
jgi:hypothetical protein